MALRPRLVVIMDNISEGSRNVAFESKVHAWYKNWDSNKELKFHTCIAI
jgi:hypothetical protein